MGLNEEVQAPAAPAPASAAAEGAASEPATPAAPAVPGASPEPSDDEIDVFSNDAAAQLERIGVGTDRKFTRAELEAMPPGVRAQLGWLRAGFTKKTQEVAEQRKALEAREKALAERERALATEAGKIETVRSGALRTPEAVRKLLSEDIGPEPDAYDVEKRAAWLAKKEVRALLGSYHESLEGEATRIETEQRALAEKQAREQLTAERRRFIEETPDYKTYHPKVKELLRTHPTLRIDEAYALAKARSTSLAEEQRAAAAAGARPGGGGARDDANARPPAGLEPRQLVQWLRDHPAAAAAIRREYSRG